MLRRSQPCIEEKLVVVERAITVLTLGDEKLDHAGVHWNSGSVIGETKYLIEEDSSSPTRQGDGSVCHGRGS